jgi:excisionase family DNA binding protein
MPNEVAAVDPPASPRVALSVREVAQLLGVHRNTVYLQIRRGSIPVVYVGAKPLVPRQWIEEQFGALLRRPATVSLQSQPDG